MYIVRNIVLKVSISFKTIAIFTTTTTTKRAE